MPNQWSVNSQGCSQSSCGSCPSTCATTASTAVVAMAPIGTSVRVEMNRPMALSPSSEISTYAATSRSEEHTSELQSRFDLVCRLLLEKKKIVREYHNKIEIQP